MMVIIVILEILGGLLAFAFWPEVLFILMAVYPANRACFIQRSIMEALLSE
jgi:hypothetical protein